MSSASNFSAFQLSGDESNRPKDKPSYQMQQYLQADPTVTERIAQAGSLAEEKKRTKKHGAKGSEKKLEERVADREDLINGNGSNAP